MSDLETTTTPALITLKKLAEKTPGAKLVGNGDLSVADISHPKMVTGKDHAVLILDAESLNLLGNSAFPVKTAVVATGITVPEGLLEGYITVERPRFALASLLATFEKPLHSQAGIHPSAVIESSATVAPDVSVGAFSYIGPKAKIGPGTILMPHVTVGAGAVVGDHCLFHPGARIGERVIIGNRVILQHNASIGADGFSYVTPEASSVESARSSGGQVTSQNTHIHKINSNGTVILEDDVEVGACATIDRANLGATLVKKGTKIDNLVMIGHNNQIGENCLIVSQVGLSGSCVIGDRVVIAGQAGLADHLKVGNDAIIMAKSGVMRDIGEREVVVGIPALPRRETLQNVMYMGRLKDLFQEVKGLKKRLAELETEQTLRPVVSTTKP
jgi:UDP-3-O-[3-hydroxymyristoyl] glucosamine N-acyltransferase